MTENEELIAAARARVKSLGRADIETESEILLWILAAKLEATKPRTVATVEELDALPVGSVVRTAGHESDGPRIAVKDEDGYRGRYLSLWRVADAVEFCVQSGELDDLPATILYIPEGAE